MFEESFGRIVFEIMLQLKERGWASAVVMKWGPGWPDSIASVGWQMQSYYCAEQLFMCLANDCYKAWRCRAQNESAGRDVCPLGPLFTYRTYIMHMYK